MANKSAGIPGARMNTQSATPSSDAQTIKVQTPAGTVRGLVTGDGTAAWASFCGVPFAEVTRPLRPPSPRSAWEGELDCFAYGDACPQKESTGLGKLLGVKVPAGVDVGRLGDDCLNLNILTPMTSSVAAAGLTKLPVMVWIHGGSNTMCSNKGDFPGFSNTASGTFVRRGVVCVSLNYRVAAHGFLHVPDAGITNLALRDLICGLEWVQASIAAFGGNRDCVTLVGQSAGGIAIANLLGCPKAKGLFHRAIVQSAGTSIWEGSMYADVVFGDYKAAARSFLDANKRDADDWSIEAWQSLTSEQLSAVSQQLDHAKPLAKKHGALYSPPVFNSLIDDDLFEGKHPIEHIRAGCSRDVDLLVGATYCEASLLWAIIPKVPVVHQALAGLFGLLVPKMVLPLAIRGVGCSITQNTDDLMPHGALKGAAAQLVDGMGAIARERLRESTGGASGPGIISSSWAGTGESDGIMQALSYVFGCGGLASTALVQAHAEFKPPHVYELKLTDAESPKARNAHMMDLPLLFTMDDAAERAWLAGAFWGRREGRGEGMDALATGMQDCWAQFCKSGTPGDFNGMTWPKYPAGAVLSTPACSTAPFLSPGPSIQRVCKYAPNSPEALLWQSTLSDFGISPLNKSAVGGRNGGSGWWVYGLLVVAVAVCGVALL